MTVPQPRSSGSDSFVVVLADGQAQPFDAESDYDARSRAAHIAGDTPHVGIYRKVFQGSAPRCLVGRCKRCGMRTADFDLVCTRHADCGGRIERINL